VSVAAAKEVQKDVGEGTRGGKTIAPRAVMEKDRAEARRI